MTQFFVASGFKDVSWLSAVDIILVEEGVDAFFVKEVLDAVEPGDIILMHDAYQTSVEAAMQIVDALKGKGYEFVTVDELILT